MPYRPKSLRAMTVPRLLVLLLLSLLATSCSKPRFKSVYPVKGRVLVNGEPAEGVTVRFMSLNDPDDPLVRPSATTDAAGWFTATTYKKEDGVPAGSYAVTLVWLPKGYVGPRESANKLPTRYGEAATSGIQVQIRAGSNELPPFELHL
jgi:hypothetical protein